MHLLEKQDKIRFAVGSLMEEKNNVLNLYFTPV